MRAAFLQVNIESREAVIREEYITENPRALHQPDAERTTFCIPEI